MKTRLLRRERRKSRSPREIRRTIEDTMAPAVISRGEGKNSRRRCGGLECEADDFAWSKTKIQIRSGPDAARNGGADETTAAGLELRRRLNGISSSSPQWAHHGPTQTSRSRMDTL